MNTEKSNDEDIKIKAKIKEMQKHIPLLQEFLRSTKSGENNAVKHQKVQMMYGFITGEIPCTKLSTLMRIEEAILKKKETKQTRVTQETNASKDSKASKENALEIINLDSSDDDDDVEIVSYIAPEPKRIISGSEDNKFSTCIALVKPENEEMMYPIELGNRERSEKNDVKPVSNSRRTSNKEIKETEIHATTSKEIASDENKNNECIPDLNEQAEEREELLGITLKNQIPSGIQSKKIKINLKSKEPLKSVMRKTCDSINMESDLPSVNIANKTNSTESTQNVLKGSKNMPEVSSTTPQVEKITSKITEGNESSTISQSKSTVKAAKASQKSETKPNKTKKISEINQIDFENVSSEEENVFDSSRDVSPYLKRLSILEKYGKLLNEEVVPVTTADLNQGVEQGSNRKYSNNFDSIENYMETIQDLDFGENNERIVSSTTEELTVFKVSEDCEKLSAKVSSSYNECGPQVNEKSLQTSPISEDPLSPMLSPNISRYSKEEKEIKDDDVTSAINQDTIASSQDSAVLWINDSETEEFIKRINLQIELEHYSPEKTDDKEVLTKTAIKGTNCKISNRRLSQVESPTKRDVPRLKSEVFKVSDPKLRKVNSKNRANSTSSTQRSQSKISNRRRSQAHSLDAIRVQNIRIKNQVQALKQAVPITLKEGPSSLLQDRLINAGLLSDRRNSFTQKDNISCAVTTPEIPRVPKDIGQELQSSIEPASCSQHFLATKDIPNEKIPNTFEDKSNETGLLSKEVSNKPTETKSTAVTSFPEESCKSVSRDNEQVPSVELSNPKTVFEKSSSPLKDLSTEIEFSSGSRHTEHNDSLNCEVLMKLSERLLNEFNFEPEQQISDTDNKSDFLMSCTKDTSNLAPDKDKQSAVENEPDQSGIPSTNVVSMQIVAADAVVKTDEQMEKPLFERRLEKQNSQKQVLNSRSVPYKAHQVKCTKENQRWKAPNKAHKQKLEMDLDKLKRLKDRKVRRNTIQVEIDPSETVLEAKGTIENSTVKSANRETLKVGTERRKTIQIDVKATSEAEVANRAHQLEAEAEKQKPFRAENDKLQNPKIEAVRKNVRHKFHHIKFTTQKDRKKTLEKARRTSLAEASHKTHQLKTELERLKTLKVVTESRNTTQVETSLEAKAAKKKSTVESAARKHLKVGREREKSIQTEVEIVSEAAASKNKDAIEAANKALKQKESIGKEKQKPIELEAKTARKEAIETASREIELKSTPKKASQEAPGIEKCKRTINNFEDIEIKIATRKRKKPILQSSSESESEGWIGTGSLEKNFYSDDDNDDLIKLRRKKKISVLSSSSESEANAKESPRVSRQNTRKKKKMKKDYKETSSKIINDVSTEDARKPGNEDPTQLNEFQEKTQLKNNFSDLDVSNPNKIKEFACSLMKPLLKEKSFKMFQDLLENNLDATNKNRKKTISPTEGKSSMSHKVSNRELRALEKDLDDSFIGHEVRKIYGCRRSSINAEKRILSLLTSESSAEDSQNCEKEQISEKSTSHLNDEDYDTDSFVEYVSLKKKEEEVQKILKNPPVVLLMKLAPENLTKSNNSAESVNLAETATTSKSKDDENLLKPLKVVPFKHHAARRQSQCAKTKSKEKKNTNPIWHYKDSSFSTRCILCSDKFPRLVDHYIVSHPHDEVFISRLPSADVRSLEKNPGRATRHLTKQHQYIAKCFFCGHSVKGRFDKLSHHYATHTGEFPYECSTCNFMSCSKSDMVKHTKNECKKDAKLKMYYTYDKNATKINLYVCTKCNYMQLHKANVDLHLRREHDYNEIHETDVKKLILLEFVEDTPQNIVTVNESVSSDPKSDDEKIIFEIRPGGTLVRPILIKEDLDSNPVVSSSSIDVKSESVLIEPHLDQAVAIANIEGNDIQSLKSDVSIRIKSETENQSKIESANTTSVVELPKTTTCEDNVMAVIHNWEFKDNEIGSEDQNDDIEQLLQDLTSISSTTLKSSESLKTADRYSTAEDLEPSISANVEPQKEIEESHQNDLILDQLNKSDRAATCQFQDEIKVKQEDNPISFTSEDQDSPDVEIQENPSVIIEILEDENEPKHYLPKTETMLEEPSLREDEDFAPLRVENFGFQEIRDGEYIFHCFIEKCNFGGAVSFEALQDHVKTEHDIMWSGKCNVCKDKLAALLSKQPIQEELNHMLSVHVKETDENYVLNLLKPWLSETKSHKKKLLCEGMLSETSLTNLYKCMGDDCNFTSDSKLQMSQHLATHELKTKREPSNVRSWLECCYCEHYADKTLHILEHVGHVHSTSIFQCSRCFYRSSSSVSICYHQNEFHPSNVGKNTTLECSGNGKALTDDISRINKLKEENIKAVSCSVCKMKYIRKDLMIEHFKMVHNESGIPKDFPMVWFSCIFCSFEINEIKEMCLHMANKHAEELLLIGVRGIKESNVEDDISSIAYIGSRDTTELKDVKPQLNIISSEQNHIKKFEKNLLNLEDLKKFCDPDSIYNKSCEKVDLKRNERALTELSTKMVESLKYFITSEILHPCCICGKEINLENRWTDHFNRAHPTISRDAVWQCPKCPKKSSFWTYPVHFLNHHNDKQKTYFCYFCGRHFYDYPTVNKHLMSHTGKEEESKCLFFKSSQEDDDTGGDKINEIGIVLPGTNNSSVTDVIKHMIEISKKRIRRETKPAYFINLIIDLNQNICGMDYPAYIPKKERYVCSPCNNIWMDEKAFENHFKTAHRTIAAFTCPHCDISINLSSYEDVRNHLRLHSQEIIYKCYLCSMYTSHIKLLKKHVKNHRRQNIPIVRFTRDDKIVKHCYQIIHFSPLSSNELFGNKIQCPFCSTLADTYKNFDMHLSKVHNLERTYQCYHCNYQADMENVDSHIMDFHVKPYPKKFCFLSTTAFLPIQNSKGNSSHLLDDQKSKSTSNASCSKAAVIVSDVSRKRKHSDISDQCASDQVSEFEKRVKPPVLNADKSENSDSTVRDGTREGSHVCNLCGLEFANYEDYFGHTKSHPETLLGSNERSDVDTSMLSVQNHTAATLPVTEASHPSSSNEESTVPTLLLQSLEKPPMLRPVPLAKLLKPISTIHENSPQLFTFEELQNQKRPLCITNTLDLFTYICFHCFVKFKNYDHLFQHWMLSTCPANENKSFKFRISEIGENCIARHVLDRIVKMATIKSVYYQCSECGKIFLNKAFCFHHMASKLLAPYYHTYEQEGLLYGCDECNVFYNNEEEAILHIAEHTFRFSCLICQTAYRSREELYLHYRHTHKINEKQYKYDVKSSRNMFIYQQMLVIFPCGLVLTKDNLRRTCWGNVKAFTKLIDKLIKKRH